MKLGITGLPNVGKSTLFNAITKAGAEAANYPFCTIDPNIGVVTVPDERVDRLSGIYHSKKTIYTTIEFCDIAGLVKGASKGEGLGNQFLGHIRNVEAIVHVVRCFSDSNVVHVDGRIDPLSDIETINTELILSDMEILDRRILRTSKMLKSDKTVKKELDILQELYEWLGQGKTARTMDMEDEEAEFVKTLDLLSFKPVIYAANVSEDEAASEGETNDDVKKLRSFAREEGSDVIVICAKIEAELSELDDEEKKMFLEEMGISEPGLDKLIKASYRLLDLIS
ncbi:MAG TPA: redox-regulated ATPase YchF, partial [Bacillota bacterium]|nr:redox-regulated ATPase YchF [Bacillota bacterium]